MEKDKITKDQAIVLIGNKEYIHTLRDSGFGSWGADINREDLIDNFNKYEDSLELSGKTARGMNHGLVMKDSIGYLFIETDEEALCEIEERLNS
jgi:hypothetical protein